jgi:hypothetical protein
MEQDAGAERVRVELRRRLDDVEGGAVLAAPFGEALRVSALLGADLEDDLRLDDLEQRPDDEWEEAMHAAVPSSARLAPVDARPIDVQDRIVDVSGGAELVDRSTARREELVVVDDDKAAWADAVVEGRQ